MKKYILLITIFSLVIVAFLNISAGNASKNYSKDYKDMQVKDLGIGPVKTVELGAINKKMVDDGKVLFNSKCLVCHEFDQKKVGPPLRNITKDRTPEYIMNLLVNSAQMQKENATVKDLLKQYKNVPMPNPGINQTQARSILEYLRSVAK